MTSTLPQKTSLNVLVAEDSEYDYELCIGILQRQFSTIAERVDSAPAFHHLLNSGTWDVILCDFSMPQFTAFDALKIYHATGRDIPFIVVSGSISEEDAVNCMKAGAHDYLIKDRLTKLPYAIEREIREAYLRKEHQQQETMAQELYAQLQNFRAALDASALVSITDLQSKILSINALFCRVSGYEERELVGSYHRIVNSGYHPKEFWEDFWTTIVSGATWRGEIQNRAKDGSLYWVDTTIFPIRNSLGEMSRFMSIRYVITERKQGELQLIESEQRFRMLADTAPVLIWMTDASKEVVYLNKSWAEFTGRAENQDVGHGWLEAVHPEDRERVQEDYFEAFDAREAVRLEYRLRHHSGEYRWVLDTGRPRYLPNGAFAGYIGSCVDITDRKEAEDFLQATNEVLEKRVQERTEALRYLNEEKNEFLGIAAHDLKNPLAGIRMTAEILERYYNNSDEKAAQFTRRIVTSCDQMLEIISNLLDVARIENEGNKLSLQVVSLGVVDAIVEEYHPRAAQKGIILFYEPLPTPHEIYADRQALYQVLDNLVSNAVKYSPAWQHVWVRVERRESVIRIAVQDNGPGLTAADKEKLFTKFGRLSAQPTGQESSTGLGLSIVKRLVEAMNGKVWCESEQGAGATFIVEFAAVEQQIP